MTVDELSTLVMKTALAMNLPVVKIGAVEADRRLAFGTKRARPTGLDPVEPHVVCEIQKDGGMKVGRMTITVAFANAGPGTEHSCRRQIERLLFNAASDAGLQPYEKLDYYGPRRRVAAAGERGIEHALDSPTVG